MMPVMDPEELLKALLPQEGTLEYKVFISTMKGAPGQWLFIAVKLPEAEEDADEAEEV